MNNAARRLKFRPMKNAIIITVFLVAGFFTTAAQAACFVDYKAKRGQDGLELHYGVMAIQGMCEDALVVEAEVQSRIAPDGWQLLRVMSSFDENGLKDKEADAGEFFLRY